MSLIAEPRVSVQIETVSAWLAANLPYLWCFAALSFPQFRATTGDWVVAGQNGGGSASEMKRTTLAKLGISRSSDICAKT